MPSTTRVSTGSGGGCPSRVTLLGLGNHAHPSALCLHRLCDAAASQHSPTNTLPCPSAHPRPQASCQTPYLRWEHQQSAALGRPSSGKVASKTSKHLTCFCVVSAENAIHLLTAHMCSPPYTGASLTGKLGRKRRGRGVFGGQLQFHPEPFDHTVRDSKPWGRSRCRSAQPFSVPFCAE